MISACNLYRLTTRSCSRSACGHVNSLPCPTKRPEHASLWVNTPYRYPPFRPHFKDHPHSRQHRGNDSTDSQKFTACVTELRLNQHAPLSRKTPWDSTHYYYYYSGHLIKILTGIFCQEFRVDVVISVSTSVYVSKQLHSCTVYNLRMTACRSKHVGA